MNKVFYKNSQKMSEVKSGSVDLIITSPPYFNIKDYSKDGKQEKQHSERKNYDVGGQDNYKDYINELVKVWKECHRILNFKLK